MSGRLIPLLMLLAVVAGFALLASWEFAARVFAMGVAAFAIEVLLLRLFARRQEERVQQKGDGHAG